MNFRNLVRGLTVVSWLLLVGLVLIPALTAWKPAGLAIFGWCEGIFGFGLPDFVMVESSHFSRFGWRCAAGLVMLVLAFCFGRRLPSGMKRSVAWMTLFIGATASLMVVLGYWERLLEVEGRYEAKNMAERIFGMPIRILCMVGIAGGLGLLFSTTSAATQAAFRFGIWVSLLLSMLAVAASIWVWGDVVISGMYSARRTAAFLTWISAILAGRLTNSQPSACLATSIPIGAQSK